MYDNNQDDTYYQSEPDDYLEGDDPEYFCPNCNARLGIDNKYLDNGNCQRCQPKQTLLGLLFAEIMFGIFGDNR